MSTDTTTTNSPEEIIRAYMSQNGKIGGSNGRGESKRRNMKKIWKTRRENARRKRLEELKQKEAVASE